MPYQSWEFLLSLSKTESLEIHEEKLDLKESLQVSNCTLEIKIVSVVVQL